MSTIRIQRRAYSSVPDDILTDERLSWPARVVLSWMLGRSADFNLHVWHVQKTFKLSSAQWVRIRRNLQAYGYFSQAREQEEGTGKWVWTNTVTDTPPKGNSHPSPQKPGDGKPSPGEPCHGTQGDKPGGVIPPLINTTPPTPPALTSDQEQAIQDELDGRRGAAVKGELPPLGNETAWLKKLRQRAAAGEDITTERGKRVRAARESEARLDAQRRRSAGTTLQQPPAFDLQQAATCGVHVAAMDHLKKICKRKMK